jgi:hypothetical protein
VASSGRFRSRCYEVAVTDRSRGLRCVVLGGRGGCQKPGRRKGGAADERDCRDGKFPARWHFISPLQSATLALIQLSLCARKHPPGRYRCDMAILPVQFSKMSFVPSVLRDGARHRASPQYRGRAERTTLAANRSPADASLAQDRRVTNRPRHKRNAAPETHKEIGVASSSRRQCAQR